jgi:hypothetical protein
MTKTETSTLNTMLIVLLLAVGLAITLLSTTLPAAKTFQFPAHVEQSCNPRTEWATYRLRDGESLETLAQQLGVSREMLSSANCMDTDNIASGIVLYVPALPAS